MTTGYGASSEDADRLINMQNRMAKLCEVESKIKRLNVVLSRLAVSERKTQLSLLKQAKLYTETIAKASPPGVRRNVTIIANELQSLHEGITANIVTPQDLVLISGLRALQDIGAIKLKLQGYISRNKNQVIAAEDPSEQLLLKNKEMGGNLPALGKKNFIVIRAPVAFTFTNPNGKHSSVGYVDSDSLKRLGFKVDNLEGYTIIHNQMLIGVNHDALIVDRKESTDADGTKVMTLVMDSIKESHVKFKANKPYSVMVKRAKTLIDVAKDTIKLIETKTKVKYSLVSDTSSRYSDSQWYWVMPAKDVTRMSKAFPGGHMKISHWGPAFPVEKNARQLQGEWLKHKQDLALGETA